MSDDTQAHGDSAAGAPHVEAEGQDILATKRVAVREPAAGELLLWGVPAHAYTVAGVRQERRLGGLLSRHIVSLSDVDGARKDYVFSPTRHFVVTTDPRMPVAAWFDVAEQYFQRGKPSSSWASYHHPNRCPTA